MIKIDSFYDSHLHVLGLGLNQTIINLEDIKSISSFHLIKSDKDFLIGRGWHQNQFKEQRFPNKGDLNTISTTKPIIFFRVCGHVLVCNDKAMELAGVSEDTPQIKGGSFDYHTGIFTEDAMKLITSIIPTPTKDDIKDMFIQANNYLLSQGITSVASDDFSTLNVPYELIIECLEELYNDGLMQIRLYEQVNLPSKELLLDYINKGYHKKEYNGFKLGSLKLLADGSLGGRTAYLNKPYSDDPSNKGIEVFTEEELEELVYIADSNNMDVSIHAIGDGMIDNVINAIYKSMMRTNRTRHRHSIIHAQLATKKQIKRMADLNITAIVQPIFINSDLPIIESRLGFDRMYNSYLFKTMYNEGVRVSFSTDAPVEPVNPFYNIYTAITRTSIKHPSLGVYNKEEQFTLKEALTCYTTNNYYHSYDEGNIENDYIIIDIDIHNTSPEALLHAKVLETYIDGLCVYKRNK